MAGIWLAAIERVLMAVVDAQGRFMPSPVAEHQRAGVTTILTGTKDRFDGAGRYALARELHTVSPDRAVDALESRRRVGGLILRGMDHRDSVRPTGGHSRAVIVKHGGTTQRGQQHA